MNQATRMGFLAASITVGFAFLVLGIVLLSSSQTRKDSLRLLAPKDDHSGFVDTNDLPSPGPGENLMDELLNKPVTTPYSHRPPTRAEARAIMAHFHRTTGASPFKTHFIWHNACIHSKDPSKRHGFFQAKISVGRGPYRDYVFALAQDWTVITMID